MRNEQTLLEQHKKLHEQIERLETQRLIDRSAETKLKLVRLKKRKLAVKDQLQQYDT